MKCDFCENKATVFDYYTNHRCDVCETCKQRFDAQNSAIIDALLGTSHRKPTLTDTELEELCGD